MIKNKEKIDILDFLFIELHYYQTFQEQFRSILHELSDLLLFECFSLI